MRTVIFSNETISPAAAAEAALHGETIASYPADRPLRTLALCALVLHRPLACSLASQMNDLLTPA